VTAKLMRIPEPNVSAVIDQGDEHLLHGASQLWVKASSKIPGQWETWWCRSCRVYLDRYESMSRSLGVIVYPDGNGGFSQAEICELDLGVVSVEPIEPRRLTMAPFGLPLSLTFDIV